tara:strand:- start:4531 stop:5637 length:1107 start_codon:yes stop_codon:yes gene_type:complete
MPRKVTYLYFDDSTETAIPVKDNLDNEDLVINIERELSWVQIVGRLLDVESTFDGLILDWRLDGTDASKADFSSEALAQQCRRLQVDKVNGRGFTKSFPIILCSAQQGFSTIYKKDTTSEDLFDSIFDKSELEDEGEFLLSLVKGYKTLSEPGVSIQKIIGLDASEQKKIDDSLIRKIIEIKERQPHEMVQFLLKEVIDVKGALIDNNTLAVRLGVDPTSDGWEVLKKEMAPFKYKGILLNDERWWADLINEWWTNEFEGTTLKFLTSSERINSIEKKYIGLIGLLKEPKLSVGSDSKEFWTVCYATKNPIAEVDGFIIDKHLHYSWQEREYICLDEAKNEDFRGEIWGSLLSYEEERLKSYFEDTTK